jgi:head-tail adaptor
MESGRKLTPDRQKGREKIQEMVKELKDYDKLWKDVVDEQEVRSEKCDDVYVCK